MGPSPKSTKLGTPSERRCGILGAIIYLERLDRELGLVDVLGVVDVLDRRQCAGMPDFGSAAITLACLWNQQRCSRVAGTTSRTAFQNPGALSPTAKTGAAIPRQIGLQLGGIALSISKGDELLVDVDTYSEHHQQAELLLLKADFDVDAVESQVHVVGTRQVGLPEGSWLRLATGW
jgi:hypothetical protein